jgi:hypothetical protein
MTTLIDWLNENRFVPEEVWPEGDDTPTYYSRVVGTEFGFTIKVQVKESKWIKDWTPYGHTEWVPCDPPRVSLYLPHSCDEWVIAPYGEGYGEGEGREVANSFAVGAIDAAILFNRTLDLIAKVQSGLNGSQS